MAKATKSQQAKGNAKAKGKVKAGPQKPAGLEPMTGLQKAAWWSVPMLGFVLLACGSTLGVLLALKPEAPANQVTVKQDAKVDEPIARFADKRPVAKEEVEVVSKLETPAEVPAQASANDPPNKPVNEPVAAATPADNEITPVALSTASTVSTVATDANVLTSLLCSDGKIQYQGTTQPVFVNKQPTFETTEKGGVKFEHLVFDGVDQSVELPDVPKDAGSIDLVCKMPERVTSIVLDSNFQRLTLRKNREGFRWRIDAKKKTNKITLSPAELDYRKWHHVAITWNHDADAILFVDGVEQDRVDYVNEQPQFATFQKIVLGRTRGPGGRFYESSVHRYRVLDQPMTPAEIAEQYDELKSSFPFIFN